MIKEVNATPFTKRHHYQVEEVSAAEFLAELARCGKGTTDELANLRFIRAKLDSK